MQREHIRRYIFYVLLGATCAVAWGYLTILISFLYEPAGALASIAHLLLFMAGGIIVIVTWGGRYTRTVAPFCSEEVVPVPRLSGTAMGFAVMSLLMLAFSLVMYRA